MSIEQLLLVLPSASDTPGGHELSIHQWNGLVEQFAAHNGRELLLGGREPLGFPGFWQLVRRGLKAGIPRVTAYLSGSLLEPWVMRELVERAVHILLALDSLSPEVHDQLHGTGSHGRALAALEAFLKQGLGQRLGMLSTATRLNHQELPMLGAWAAGRGVSRFLWTGVPDGGWPSPQLRALRLSPEEKMTMAREMHMASRTFKGSSYMGPVDALEDPLSDLDYSGLLRIDARGEACWGFSGEGGRLGNVKTATLKDLLDRGIQAVGD
jgi:MoaA/NifB/PqqE/SkfB family radical SAM enzyme